MFSPFNLPDIIAVDTFHGNAHPRGYYAQWLVMFIQSVIWSSASFLEGDLYPKEIIMLRSTTIQHTE